jgi:hypothetical protein
VTDTSSDVAEATDHPTSAGTRPAAEKDKARHQAQDALPGSTAAEIPLGLSASAEELAAAGGSPRAGNLNESTAAQQAEHERGDAAHGSSPKKSGSSSRSGDSKAKSRAGARSAVTVKTVEPAAIARPQSDPDVGF